MFKKKPNIPPRPKPPTSDMLMEDIQACIGDEILLNVARTSSAGSPPIDTLQSISEKSSDPEVIFEQVKMFVEINQNLRDMVKKLQSQNEILQNSNVELKLKAEDIRKQALNALN